MYCKNCGKKLPDEAIFCGYCGVKIEKLAKDSISLLSDEPAEDTSPVPETKSVIISDDFSKGKSNKLLIAIIAVVMRLFLMQGLNLGK